jgi:TRAP transporter 4TM/12TM fusion protein
MSEPRSSAPVRFRLLDVLSESERVVPTGISSYVVGALSVVASLSIAYLALWGTETQHFQVSNLILLIFTVAFLTTSIYKGVHRLTLWDLFLALVSVALGLWFMLNDAKYQEWTSGFSTLSTADTIAGLVLIAVTVELCRRCIGIGLTAIVAFLLAYAAWGHLIAGSFSHAPIKLGYFLEMQTVGTDGIFGSPLYVAASYAFMFVLFGNFYVLSGGGQLFFDFAAAVTGRMVGGPAKACVVSSGLYGSISGSPVADVATTGPVSIPIMRRIGISAERAGAIEAAASTGGAILPPVMGAVAFLMADFTGIPYNQIAFYAVAPALAYYLGVMTMVHFESRRLDLGRVPEEEIVGFKAAIMRNWPSLIPIFVLIALLVMGYSAAYVAAGSALSVVVASWAKREGAIGPRRFVQACVETCTSMVPLAAAVAAAGLVIGCIELTGLSGKFTLLLFQLSGGYLVPTLIISAVVLILLGMGMPTTGVYIMGIALLAPVFITQFKLPMMETHMFMLFFSCMSAITPPVAVACFAAASIAKCNPFRIAPYACTLAVGGFAMPFFFIFNPGILMQGDLVTILLHVAVGFMMVLTLCVALHGHIVKLRLSAVTRLAFTALAIGMIVPDWRIQIPVVVAALAFYLLLQSRALAEEKRALALSTGK